MLYDLLPLLKGWRYKNTVVMPDIAIVMAGGTFPPLLPLNLLVGLDGAVGRGMTTPITLERGAVKERIGWLLSVVFRASDTSCKLNIKLDGESYEISHIGTFEPPAPMPFHDLKIDVSMENNSSEQVAIYYCAVNRIIIDELNTFKEGLQKLGLIHLVDKLCSSPPGGRGR